MAFILLAFIMGLGSTAYTQPIFNLQDPKVQQQIQEAAFDEIWLNQLQYERRMNGDWVSDVVEGDFFFSKEGKYNPQAELKATLEALVNTPEMPRGYLQQAAVCAFPTRRRFVEEKFKITIKKVPCPEYDHWKEPFLNSELVLIFSDAFPNNPASMFGHTFLLFSKHKPYDSAEGLMDYSINFSADTGAAEEDSIWHSFRGILGGYKARYQISPFYVMANQYIGWDSRDLWYMPLNFTPAEVERVTEHLWESFSNAAFDYYFFNKNCSYRLLTALDYGRPGFQLHQKFNFRWPLYYVTPISTYKEVTDHFGRKSEESYSPSIRKKFVQRIQGLSAEQLDAYNELLKNPELTEKTQDVQVLDAVLAYYDYKKKTASKDYLPEWILNGIRRTAVHRAQLGQVSPKIQYVNKDTSPYYSHRNIQTQTEINNKENGLILGIRPGYHDLMSSDKGLIPWSHLEFMTLVGQFSTDKVRLLDVTFINLISFFTIESFDIKPSWRSELGWTQEKHYFAKAGIGLSKELVERELMVYGFLNPEFVENVQFSKNPNAFLFSLELGFIRKWDQNKIWYSANQYFREKNWGGEDGFYTHSLNFAHYLDANHELRLSAETYLDLQQEDFQKKTSEVRTTLGYWVSF